MKKQQLRGAIPAMIIALGCLTLGSCQSPAPQPALNPSGFHIMRGVNLSHWLSQDFGWAPKYTWIQEEDIRFIDSIGYDHVRIPVDEHELWDENGVPIQEAFYHLRKCLEWCQKYNLRAVVDLHILRSHHFNAANEGGVNTLWVDPAAQDAFVNMWIELSDTLRHYPVDMVAYEFLNEVVAPEHDDWNRLLNRAIAAIREREPDRVLVIGSNMWKIASNLKYLDIPENDRNIILSFHIYSPLAFTHYQAEWTPAGSFNGRVNYPGQIISDEDFEKYIDTSKPEIAHAFADARDYFDKQRLIDVFISGVEFAKSKNLQLYCAEFGCLPTVEREDRLRYYSDIIDAFEEHNIAWSNWEYKGDFGIFHFDREKQISMEPDFELIEILLKNR